MEFCELFLTCRKSSTLTTTNSLRAANTNIIQPAIQMSSACINFYIRKDRHQFERFILHREFDNKIEISEYIRKLTLIYATGGISLLRPVNIVTNVSILVTRRATRPGMASKSSQKLNQESITTRVDGANVCIKWWPICLSKRKKTTSREKFPSRIVMQIHIIKFQI